MKGISASPGVAPRRHLVAAAVAALLVVVGGYHAGRLVVLAMGGPALPSVVVDEGIQVAAPGVHARPEDAAQWTLYGDADSAPAVTQADDAPKTTLQLTLLGVFSTRDEKLAGAVIAERGSVGDLYRIGASLPGGATLERVEPDRVLLRRRGQLETLRFEDLTTIASVAPGTRGMDVLGGFRNIRSSLGQPDLDEEDEVDVPRSPGSMFDSLATGLQENPEGVIAEFGLEKAQGGGYEVTGKSPPGLRNLGLRPGDVVLSINGEALGNPAEDAALIEEVRASGEVNIEIRRGSQVFTVNHPL